MAGAPAIRVEERILVVRGLRVLLDSDLAELYGVPTRRLNEQVRRNRERFPEDFMVELEWEEFESLRSQIATLDAGSGRGQHRKHPPLAFTEQGVAMLSGVLRSERAVQANILIMRAFVRSRAWRAGHAELIRKLDDLEKKYDRRFHDVFEAIRVLMAPEAKRKRQIGFGR